MKTLVSAIQKGGVGKTFVACHLADDFKARGQRVVVIDLDTQGNASWTLEAYKSDVAASELFGLGGDFSQLRNRLQNASERAEGGLMVIYADPLLVEVDQMTREDARDALHASIELLGEFFDVCLIDTEPSLGIAMSSSLMVGDFMVSPILLEAYSINGAVTLLDVFENIKPSNPSLEFLGLLPNMVDRRKARHVANLEFLRSEHADSVMPVHIGARDSIAQALGEQRLVWDIKKTAARVAVKEVREMAAYIYKKMGLQ